MELFNIDFCRVVRILLSVFLNGKKFEECTSGNFYYLSVKEKNESDISHILFTVVSSSLRINISISINYQRFHLPPFKTLAIDRPSFLLIHASSLIPHFLAKRIHPPYNQIDLLLETIQGYTRRLGTKLHLA